MPGKYGMTYTGNVATGLGYLLVVLGPFVAIGGLVGVFVNG